MDKRASLFSQQGLKCLPGAGLAPAQSAELPLLQQGGAGQHHVQSISTGRGRENLSPLGGEGLEGAGNGPGRALQTQAC